MNFVGYGQLLATLSATGSQNAATVSRLHALTETMLVVSLSVVRLECSFHFRYAVFCFLIYISFVARKVSTVAPSLAALSSRGTFTLRGANLGILFDTANFLCSFLAFCLENLQLRGLSGGIEM